MGPEERDKKSPSVNSCAPAEDSEAVGSHSGMTAATEVRQQDRQGLTGDWGLVVKWGYFSKRVSPEIK